MPSSINRSGAPSVGGAPFRQDVLVPGLGEPRDPDGPLFVYGLLQPGELAYSLIAEHVADSLPGTVSGCLRLRDGLPLLDASVTGQVLGHLLRFDPPTRRQSWEVVAGFEPGSQYQYDTVAVDLDGEQVQANALVGRQLGRGTAPEMTDRWSAAFDPVFVEGLAEVLTMTIEAAPEGVAVQPDQPELWHQFFRLQAAYLLLWAVVERYTAFRYGPGLAAGERVGCLGRDATFQAAVVEAGAVPDVVYDSRTPANKDQLRADGSGAADYFYRVRSNLSHRGKSAFRDGQLVFKTLVELHDAMRLLLARQVPALADAWQRHHEQEGWLLRERLPEGAIASPPDDRRQ